jgi:hypothetical protein
VLHAGPSAQPLWQHAAAGSVAGLVQAPVACAVEVVKTLVQNQTHAASVETCPPPRVAAEGALVPECRPVFRGSFDLAAHLVREHGPGALLRGHCATVLRDALPGYGVYFAVYEACRRHLVPALGRWERALLPVAGRTTETSLRGGRPLLDAREDRLHRIASPGAVAIAGGAAGIIGWIVIYPLDTIKTGVQARWPGEPSLRITDCAREVVRHGGLRGLFRGCGASLSRAVPANAATFYVYEWVMSKRDAVCGA